MSRKSPKTTTNDSAVLSASTTTISARERASARGVADVLRKRSTT